MIYLLKKKFKRLSSRHFVSKLLCPCGNIFTRRLRGNITCLVCRGKYKNDVINCYKKIYREYKRSAIRRFLSFDILFNDFIILISKNCSYCGAERSNSLKTKFGIFKYSGIDRVDNRLGYLFSNCISACKICNFAKRDMDKNSFVEWAKTVAKIGEITCS